MALPLTGCDAAPAPTPAACAVMRPGEAAPADLSALSDLVEEVRTSLFPALSDVSLVLVPLDSSTDFFQSNVDLSTVSERPLDRTYRLNVNLRPFDDPPSQPAVAAILAHELTHTLDYAALDAEGLVRFGLWYATSDVAAYERETDEHALALGCAPGLVDYRTWLYAHIADDAVAEKRRVYYTPEEIAAWVAANTPDRGD